MRLEEWKKLYERVKPRFDFTSAAVAFKETERQNQALAAKKQRQAGPQAVVRCLKCTRPLKNDRCQKCDGKSYSSSAQSSSKGDLKRRRNYGRYFDEGPIASDHTTLSQPNTKRRKQSMMAEVKSLKLFHSADVSDSSIENKSKERSKERTKEGASSLTRKKSKKSKKSKKKKKKKHKASSHH